jgi:hypothetical protein
VIRRTCIVALAPLDASATFGALKATIPAAELVVAD